MKLPFLATLAALALAGSSFAQPPIPIASDFEGSTSTPTAHEQLHPSQDQAISDVLRSVQKASSRVRLACAADQATYCADAKTTFSADRCLERHRRDINVACALALSQATLAWSSPR